MPHKCFEILVTIQVLKRAKWLNRMAGMLTTSETEETYQTANKGDCISSEDSKEMLRRYLELRTSNESEDFSYSVCNAWKLEDVHKNIEHYQMRHQKTISNIIECENVEHYSVRQRQTISSVTTSNNFECDSFKWYQYYRMKQEVTPVFKILFLVTITVFPLPISLQWRNIKIFDYSTAVKGIQGDILLKQLW
jgi:hypothetical protein